MESLFLIVLSMLAIESADSIRLLYRHFLSKVTEKSLNAFYYVCSYAKIDCSKFMNVTARLALQIILEHLCNEPVFLCVDDTMISKFGRKYENLDIICNARYDSVIYVLPPVPTGKRGRPAKRGKRLSLIEDFSLSAEKTGDYYVSVRKVLTNIFGDRCVHAYVTVGSKTTETRRFFFSTIASEAIRMACAWQETAPLDQTGREWMQYVPLFVYCFRWKI